MRNETLESVEKSSSDKANVHALLILVAAGFAVLLIELLIWWTPLVESFSPSVILVEIYVSVIAVIFLIQSLYGIWASIWIVFGSGRWMTRIASSFLLFEAILIVLLSLIPFRLGGPWGNTIEVIPFWASASIALIIQVSVMSVFLRALKAFRYRLIYYSASSALSKHPPSSEAGQREPEDITLQSESLTIVDLLQLTIWTALPMALFSPINKILSSSTGFSSGKLIFVMMLCGFGFSSCVAFLLLLPYTCVVMLNHRGLRFQLIVQLILMVPVVALILGLHAMNFLVDDRFHFAIGAALLTALYFLFFSMLLLRRRRWFRFRFVRIGKEASVLSSSDAYLPNSSVLMAPKS